MIAQKIARSWSCDRNRIVEAFSNWDRDRDRNLNLSWRSGSGSRSQFWRSGSCLANNAVFHLHFPGKKTVYVYPDFKTVLFGTFEKDVLIEAKPSEISAVRCKNGMIELKIRKIKPQAKAVSFFKPNPFRINDQVLDVLYKSCIFSIFNLEFSFFFNLYFSQLCKIHFNKRIFIGKLGILVIHFLPSVIYTKVTLLLTIQESKARFRSIGATKPGLKCMNDNW